MTFVESELKRVLSSTVSGVTWWGGAGRKVINDNNRSASGQGVHFRGGRVVADAVAGSDNGTAGKIADEEAVADEGDGQRGSLNERTEFKKVHTSSYNPDREECSSSEESDEAVTAEEDAFAVARVRVVDAREAGNASTRTFCSER